MTHKIINHLKQHSIAWVALFFALGGGGGYAVAATRHPSTHTIHACVSKRTGELFVARRCSRSTRTLVFNQRGPAGVAGAPAAQVFGALNAVGSVRDEEGATVTEVSVGVYNVTVTAGGCSGPNAINVPTVSAYGAPPSGEVPDVVAGPSTTAGVSFVIDTGDIVNGAYVPGGQGADFTDQCS